MVFVTVGNATQGFRRLLDAVEDIIASGYFGQEAVVIQSGHNPGFGSLHANVFPFISVDEFDRQMESASLIICHGGCTQLHAIRLGKVPVVMPRRKKYGEHVNDHQMQLLQALAHEGKIVPAYEPADLMPAIIEAKRRNETPLVPSFSPMLLLVGQAIDELSGRRAARRRRNFD
jgi:UDP-N-acetylglucosamine transferase subunit ALG13